MTKLNFKNNLFTHWLRGSLLFTFLVVFPGKIQALLQVNQVILVDDFDDKDSLNRLGGKSEGDEEFPGGCIPNFISDEEAFGKKGASLILDYDLTAPNSFSHYWNKLGQGDPLKGTNEAQNLSEMRYLSFWMKTEGGTGPRLEFFVELHEDTNGDQRFILGDDTTDRVPASRFAMGTARDGWQKAAIPLSRFRKIRHWDQMLEIVIVFESKWRIGRGKLFLDDLLLGSNYPEELQAAEIQMQNRVSSFKIGNELASSEMKLEPKHKSTSLALTLTFIDPYLEAIEFQESRDQGQTWRRLQSFYDHSGGGVYTADWEIPSIASSKEKILLRATGVSVLGGETQLAGPYDLYFG